MHLGEMTDMVFFLPVLSCPSFKLCVRNHQFQVYPMCRCAAGRWRRLHHLRYRSISSRAMSASLMAPTSTYSCPWVLHPVIRIGFILLESYWSPLYLVGVVTYFVVKMRMYKRRSRYNAISRLSRWGWWWWRWRWQWWWWWWWWCKLGCLSLCLSPLSVGTNKTFHLGRCGRRRGWQRLPLPGRDDGVDNANRDQALSARWAERDIARSISGQIECPVGLNSLIRP